MRQLKPHLHLATTVKIANSWLMTDEAGRKFVFDTGWYTDRPALKMSLWLAGVRRRGDLAGVILTHRHGDHASNAAWLRETYDCPVICHEADAKILMGEQPRPKQAKGQAPLYQEWLNLFEDRFPARSFVDEVFESGKWKWGFQVIHTPGHTEGSSMLYHEPSKTLFSGDSILAGLPPLRMIEHLSLAAPGFSQETERCHKETLRYLKEMPKIEHLCSGHGPLISDDTHKKLGELIIKSERLSAVAHDHAH